MKLPAQYNLYKINEQIDALENLATRLADEEYSALWGIEEMIQQNEVILRQMTAIITHLELVVDEVLKIPGVSDE